MLKEQVGQFSVMLHSPAPAVPLTCKWQRQHAFNLTTVVQSIQVRQSSGLPRTSTQGK